jgi:hypothetical protein
MCARAVRVSTISGKGGLNQMALLVIWCKCKKKEYRGVYMVGLDCFCAYRYRAERLSGVAKAQTSVRSPPICVNSVRVMV